MIQFDTVNSTQDEARRILQGKDKDFSVSTTNDCFAITTNEQSKGRGTSGRDWIGKRGNAFLTLAVPQAHIKIPLTLLPLQIGCILAQQVQSILEEYALDKVEATDNKSERNVVQLKWPNDVLIDKKKVAGILIESERSESGEYYFLIGIGVNWRYAPLIDQVGPQNGREATCIYDCIEYDEDETSQLVDGVEEARQLASKTAQDIFDWIRFQRKLSGEDVVVLGENIIRQWEKSGDFSSRQIIRDTQENVFPIALEKDGRLRVRGRNGKEKLLVSDYLL